MHLNAWQKLSRAWRELNPYCEACLAQGLMRYCGPGKRTGVTDHIIARSIKGAPWDPRNFMTLCNDHHNRKRGLEAKGIALVATKTTVNGLIPQRREDIISILNKEQ